jgi:hypothetical protein
MGACFGDLFQPEIPLEISEILLIEVHYSGTF